MKPIEKYANTLENSLLEHGDGWGPCDEAQSKAVRAVIEAFVDDLANAMCPYCRDGMEMMDAGLGPCHLSRDGATFLGLIPCQSVMMRAAARRLMEGS